jgi:hypothetical protein
VVESNTPLDHIIRFYNNDNELLHKETLTGIKLNPERRKVKMELKKVLESSVLAWEKKKNGLIPAGEGPCQIVFQVNILFTVKGPVSLKQDGAPSIKNVCPSVR